MFKFNVLAKKRREKEKKKNGKREYCKKRRYKAM